MTAAADKQHAFVQGCAADRVIGPLHSSFVFVLFIIIYPLTVPHHLSHRVSNSSVSAVKTLVLCSRVPLVVKRENQANGGSGRRFLGAALSTPCRPTTSHHILDGQ